MTVDALEHDFLHYLKCDLPLGYPLKTPVTKLLSAAQKSNFRRELLHRQAQFLNFAQPFLGTQPWLAYLAAIKHEAVLVTIPTYDEQLVDVVDKLFFRDLQEKNKELRAASRAAIDDLTATDCDRLVRLQTEAAQIEDAIQNVAGTLQAGFAAVEPLPPPPPEPAPERKYLPYFIVGALACVVVGSVIPPYDGGMMWALAGLVVTGTIGAQVISREKARLRARSEEFKAYLIHENFHALCRKSIGLVLTLPFEVRKTALVALPQCLAALETLGPERDALEARYLDPYLRP